MSCGSRRSREGSECGIPPLRLRSGQALAQKAAQGWGTRLYFDFSNCHWIVPFGLMLALKMCGLYSSPTIDNVATSLAWIASHGRTIATVDIQEPPLSTRPNMSPTREIPILAAQPQVSCRLRTLPPRHWQLSSEKFAAGNPMTTQPRSASSAAQESARYR